MTKEWIVLQTQDRCRQCIDVARRRKQSGYSIFDQMSEAADSAGDNRTASRHVLVNLQRGKIKVGQWWVRRTCHIHGCDQARNLLRVHSPCEVNKACQAARIDSRLKLFLGASIADDQQPRIGRKAVNFIKSGDECW